MSRRGPLVSNRHTSPNPWRELAHQLAAARVLLCDALSHAKASAVFGDVPYDTPTAREMLLNRHATAAREAAEALIQWESLAHNTATRTDRQMAR